MWLFRNILSCSLLAVFLLPKGFAEPKINELETDSIEIISTTPVPGVATSIKKVPSNVQAVTSEQADNQVSTNTAEFIERNLNSVTVGHAQGNPFMPDLMFRGQLASPLLGNPQGLAVFMDGTKINESFGDTLRWDMIPENAISTINLIPGGNPAYGLNSLGGVLSFTTKSGFQNPGTKFSAHGGSWGRQSYSFEHGSSSGNNDLFLAASFFDEDGWRDESGSEVSQLFLKVGTETENTDFDISLIWADSELNGTQALPISFLGNREQAYTFPDTNENSLAHLQLDWSRYVNDNNLLSGGVYLRKTENENLNSNVNDEFIGRNAAVLAAAVFLDGSDCIESSDDDAGVQGVLGVGVDIDEDEQCPGANEGSETESTSYGFSIQWTNFTDRNTLSLGATADLNTNDFFNDEEGATFSTGTSRTTTSNGEGFEREVSVSVDNQYYGFYLSDQYDLTDTISLSGAARWNFATIDLNDTNTVTPNPALNGFHKFRRLNPALGIAFNPTPNYTTYLSYSEGMRAPTPVELTCADPEAPCKLPNAFLADPPLEKVVSKTIEWGARGGRGGFVWSFAAYNTELQDDIQFIAAGTGATNAGFFDNVGDTRRRGVEIGAGWQVGNLLTRFDYSYLEATFESTFSMDSPLNSSADGNGDITITPGNKMANIPENTFKMRSEYTAFGKWTTGLTLNYFSEIYARGDENNQDVNGTIPGFTVVNLDSTYQATKGLEIFLKINNLFDEEYENLGILGANFFNSANGTYNNLTVQNEQFRGLGAPLGVFAGINYAF